MEKIDIFAHVLLPKFYNKMLEINKDIPKKYAFVNIPSIKDMDIRRKYWNKETKQIISYANINPEDYCDSDLAYQLCKEANEELKECINDNQDMFLYGIGMVPLNNIEGALKILEDIKNSDNLIGIQLFTRHLGKSIADITYREIFKKCDELGLIILLHPVFDERKPDNNIVFSWEYELSQAMYDIVTNDIFKDYPHLKIVVHHAGAMIPYFAGRIDAILPEYKEDFKKFYVDTALIGNSKALELAIDYFSVDHVIYGTDAPFAIMPVGAVKEIEDAINKLPIENKDKEKIYNKNFYKLIDTVSIW